MVIATHTLGLVSWISGDLPGALHEMTVAEEYGPHVRSGLRALERARVLLQAGLLAEARENADLSERIFTAERSRVDLADSLLVQAEIDLLARKPAPPGRPPGGPRAVTGRPASAVGCWPPR